MAKRRTRSPRRLRAVSTQPRSLPNPRMTDRGGIGQVEVGATARADLDVELERLVAVRALAFGFVLLGPVEDHGDQAERRQDGADHEPEPERAALRPADERRR